MNRILVLGGTGFIGRHFCAKAWQTGCRLTVLTRRAESAKAIQTLPWVDVLEADVHDEASLTALAQGHGCAVNLVAILHGAQADFDHVHVALTEKLVRACRAAQVPRIVHVSAVGADAKAPSMYQRSKAQAEAVLAASGLDVAILRPSVVFGEGDQFLNLFATLQAIFPIMPLAGASTRFQPVWVEDVAQALVELVRRQAGGTLGGARPAVFEACGPGIVTLRELVQLAGVLCGHRRPIVPLPAALGRLQALVMEYLPGKTLMSRDNVDSLAVDNVASPGMAGLRELGIHASSLAAIAPTYLGRTHDNAAIAQRRSSGRL